MERDQYLSAQERERFRFLVQQVDNLSPTKQRSFPRHQSQVDINNAARSLLSKPSSTNGSDNIVLQNILYTKDLNDLHEWRIQAYRADFRFNATHLFAVVRLTINGLDYIQFIDREGAKHSFSPQHSSYTHCSSPKTESK